MAPRAGRTLALAAVATTVRVALVVHAGASPEPAAEANGVCRSLREAVVAEVAPPAIGRRPPPASELARSAGAFLPLGRRAHDRLTSIVATAGDAELTALVDAHGAALRRLEELAAAGSLGALHLDGELRQAIATTNARAVRAGTPDCVL
jgi:hypothetical protein